ncbi:MAG: hypothetical protein HOE44_01165 [Candidatus Marinimicrobia bacterium]|nr:hypothetical protein [Candidatus Neomarinimicrobiota bacterium]
MSDGLKNVIGRRIEPQLYRNELKPEQIVSARLSISKSLGDVIEGKPTNFTLDESYQVIYNYYYTNGHLNDVKNKYIRHIPYIIFDSSVAPDGVQRLELMRGFIDAYIFKIELKPVNSAVSSLLHCLISEYPSFEQFGQLYQFAQKLISEECRSYRCEQYEKCDAEFQIFQPSGVDVVWKAFSAGDRPFTERLDDLEFPTDLQLQETQFFDVVVEHGIESLKSTLTQHLSESRRMVEVVTLIDFSDKGRFKFLRVKLIDSLLLPFSHKEPSDKEAKSTIKNFLLTTFGDLRIGGAGHWHGVHKESKRVMLNWLVEDVLEDFFKLFGYVAEGDAEIERQWKYRESFWRAYLNRGLIDEAWVAMSNRMDERALKMLSLSSDRYGKVVSNYNIKRNHAALIMKIGNLVVTDWNFSGQFSVWETDANSSVKKVPLPYQKTYRSKEFLVEGATYAGSHVGAESYSWQKKLSSEIEKLSSSGVSVSKQEYSLSSSSSKRRTVRHPRNSPHKKSKSQTIDVAKLRRGKRDTGGII